MIIPFSLPARVVIEPNYKHIKEVSDSLFLEKFSSTFKESCRVKWNLVLNISFSVCDAWLSLSTMKENLSMAEQTDWKDLDDVVELLNYQPRSHSTSGLFLLGKTTFIFKSVDRLLLC